MRSYLYDNRVAERPSNNQLHRNVGRLEGEVVVDLLPPILFFVIFAAVIGHFAYGALPGHPAIRLEPSRGR